MLLMNATIIEHGNEILPTEQTWSVCEREERKSIDEPQKQTKRYSNNKTRVKNVTAYIQR